MSYEPKTIYGSVDDAGGGYITILLDEGTESYQALNTRVAITLNPHKCDWRFVGRQIPSYYQPSMKCLIKCIAPGHPNALTMDHPNRYRGVDLYEDEYPKWDKPVP